MLTAAPRWCLLCLCWVRDLRELLGNHRQSPTRGPGGHREPRAVTREPPNRCRNARRSVCGPANRTIVLAELRLSHPHCGGRQLRASRHACCRCTAGLVQPRSVVTRGDTCKPNGALHFSSNHVSSSLAPSCSEFRNARAPPRSAAVASASAPTWSDVGVARQLVQPIPIFRVTNRTVIRGRHGLNRCCKNKNKLIDLTRYCYAQHNNYTRFKNYLAM